MEYIKEKLPIAIMILIAVAICGISYYFMFYQSSNYYTKIDNTKVEKINTKDNMKYEYKLKCYNENGKEKEIKFKTSRQLKEGSYIKLKVMVSRGVISWEEVQFDELSEKIKTKYIE